MIKTIIIDDHKLFSEGVERLLNYTGHFKIIGKFNEGKSFLNNMHQYMPDLLLIDIDMPELSGLDVIKRIRVSNKHLKIVVLSMHGESAFLYEAKSLGANGYLTKSIDGSELVKHLLDVCNGAVIFPLTRPIELPTNNLLSEREEEILRLLTQGLTSEEISTRLNISPLTVKVHRRNMIRKLRVKNSAELISKAIQKGFLS